MLAAKYSLPTLLPAFLLIQNTLAVANVTWSSPVEGDVYESGQSIIGQWSVTEAILSPVFRLCSPSTQETPDPDSGENTGSEDDNCGTAVWPAVQQSNGSYEVTLAAPSVTALSDFYLEMQDEEGNIVPSPLFSLSPATSDSDSLAPPLRDPTPSLPFDPQSQSSPDPHGVAQPPQISPNLNANTQPLPNLMQTHISIPTAAYIVPLSLVGAITLCAIVLLIYHRRRLRTERSAESEKATSSLSRASGITRCPTMIWKAAFGNHKARSRRRGDDGGRRRDVDERERRETPTPTRMSSMNRDDNDHYTVYVPRLHYQQPQRQPRQQTREPFTPARASRPAVTPIYSRFTHARDNEQTIPQPGSLNEKYDEASEDEVLSGYPRPSPLPLLSFSTPTPPGRTHVRWNASSDSGESHDEDRLYPDMYDEVARTLPR
ncbi:unnamed protein product [Somion occarium]|uniref:Uncharacterized protein n=1 Tax=Somion occarium TaxID=3059160 RepID=A0ABP1CQA3_9APHY